MTSNLKHNRPAALEASILAAELEIAERNERIILDLIRGRDTRADEEKVVREAASLAHLRRRRGGSAWSAR